MPYRSTYFQRNKYAEQRYQEATSQTRETVAPPSLPLSLSHSAKK